MFPRFIFELIHGLFFGSIKLLNYSIVMLIRYAASSNFCSVPKSQLGWLILSHLAMLQLQKTSRQAVTMS